VRIAKTRIEKAAAVGALTPKRIKPRTAES
jgi:hypothetical protein